MNYELAKKLKEAGFPQKSKDSWVFSRKGIHIIRTPTRKQKIQMDLVGVDVFSKPTLSELIMACGDKFDSLIKQHAKFQASDSVNFCDGSTPEEAVANLLITIITNHEHNI
jgi:hypothetical protein